MGFGINIGFFFVFLLFLLFGLKGFIKIDDGESDNWFFCDVFLGYFFLEIRGIVLLFFRKFKFIFCIDCFFLELDVCVIVFVFVF